MDKRARKTHTRNILFVVYLKYSLNWWNLLEAWRSLHSYKAGGYQDKIQGHFIIIYTYGTLIKRKNWPGVYKRHHYNNACILLSITFFKVLPVVWYFKPLSLQIGITQYWPFGVNGSTRFKVHTAPLSRLEQPLATVLNFTYLLLP